MPPTADAALDALCGAAVRGRLSQVELMLTLHPDLATGSVHAAAALLDKDALEGHLADDPARASAPGPRALTPLDLVAATGLEQGDRAAAARLLLAHGAQPGGYAVRAAFQAARVELLECLLDAGVGLTDPLEPTGQGLLHFAADTCWQPELVARLLPRGAELEAPWGPLDETPLHIAVRRQRLDAVELLLDHGAEIDARTRGGDTGYRHAVRRPFPEIVEVLEARGADTTLAPIDRLARALHAGDRAGAGALLDQAGELLERLVPEEARLLPDLAGQGDLTGVDLLLDHGFDIEARGLDGGTALQQCAWFGIPRVARRLVERGADVDAAGCDHGSSPLGWLTHGSRHSDEAAQRADDYEELLQLLLGADARVDLPGDPPGEAGGRALADASARLAARLAEHLGRS